MTQSILGIPIAVERLTTYRIRAKDFSRVRGQTKQHGRSQTSNWNVPSPGRNHNVPVARSCTRCRVILGASKAKVLYRDYRSILLPRNTIELEFAEVKYPVSHHAGSHRAPPLVPEHLQTKHGTDTVEAV